MTITSQSNAPRGLPPAAPGQVAQGAGLSVGLAATLLVIGALAMGSSPAFARWSGLDMFASAFWRAGLALPVLFIWAWVESRQRPAFFSTNKLVVLSGLAFAGDLAFWHIAIFNTTMANATLLACLSPVWVLLLSNWVLGEHVTRAMFGGIVICIAGALLLVGGGIVAAPERLWGDLAGLITSFFFATYILTFRFARRTTDVKPATLTFHSSVITAAALLVIALVSGETFLPTTIGGAIALLALGIISHAGGQGLLAVAIGSLSAAFSSLVIFMEVVAAAFLGWAFFGEHLTAYQAAGGALILAGIFMARPRKG
ncbi:MAG: DMT family transporter [Pseudomonadota bacterium]